MKCIKQIILIYALLTHPPCQAQEESPKSSGNHALILFIRDQLTNQVITDVPLQATYGGYFVNSDHNGQIRFPRKTSNLEFYLIITPSIEPIFPLLNNVSHLQVPAANDARLYRLILQKNLKTRLWEWTVTAENLASDRHIPLHSIIILADPAQISMPTGTTLAPLSNHLILPSIYLTGPLQNNLSSITLPNNRPFLAKLTTAYNLTPYGYATMQIY
jgi:hypothetical protein